MEFLNIGISNVRVLEYWNRNIGVLEYPDISTFGYYFRKIDYLNIGKLEYLNRMLEYTDIRIFRYPEICNIGISEYRNIGIMEIGISEY